MNQIASRKSSFCNRMFMMLMTVLAAVSFSLFAMTSYSATSETGGNNQGERFDHMSTGFPLTGAHTIAECASCHVGGVFKGTPRNCSGCHGKGQRVVALSMPATHLITMDPCESCHTNTVTFFGARYNHGKAIPGQCASCHNGLTATGRPSNHTTNSYMASNSCDSCHRASAWLPSSWNHNGVVSACSTCHYQGGAAVNPADWRTMLSGTTPEAFAHNDLAISNCASCHHSFTNWYGALYDHASAGSTCSGCHNGSTATGFTQAIALYSTHTNSGECNTCHTSTSTWLGALGAMPSNHLPSSRFSPASIACSACHPTAATWTTGSALHSY
jgi:hypothetical protein